MQYWNELYREIAEKIKANLPNIVWIDLWHEQVNYLTEELPFRTPAVFIEFNTINIDDNGMLVQQCNTQVDMYLFYETFSDTSTGSYNRERAMEFLEELTKLHALFHGKAGANHSAMRRLDMRREATGDAGNLYRISFECLVTDYSARELFVDVEIPEMEIGVSSEGIPPAEREEYPLFDVE